MAHDLTPTKEHCETSTSTENSKPPRARRLREGKQGFVGEEKEFLEAENTMELL